MVKMCLKKIQTEKQYWRTGINESLYQYTRREMEKSVETADNNISVPNIKHL
jgi:hypothetical protein